MKCFILLVTILVVDPIYSKKGQQTKTKQTKLQPKQHHIYKQQLQMRFKQDQKNPKIDTIPKQIDKEMNLSEFFKLFSFLSLSNPEIQALYRFVDVNKNNRIDIDEWENFYQLFIEGFTKCDADQDFLISYEEFGKCEEFKQLFEEYQLSADYIFKVFGKDEKQNLNLNNYLYIRRMFFAWQQCSNNQEIPLTQIQCGLEIVSPRTSQFANYAFDIFHQIQKLKQGTTNDNQSVRINIQDFLLVAFIYTQFENYDFPCRDGVLSKNELKLAIDNGKVPSFFTESISNILFFDNKQSVDFNDFSIFYHVLVLFNRFSDLNSLNEEQFNKLLKDEFFPKLILDALMNTNLPTQSGIDKVLSLKKMSHQMTVEQFFISFIQLQSKVQQDPPQGDEKNLEKVISIVYNMFQNENIKAILFDDFFHFYKFSCIFILADKNHQYYINEQNLRQILNEPQQLPIKATQEQIIEMNSIVDLIQESKQTQINLKQFLSESFYSQIFERIRQVQGSSTLSINQAGILMGLKKMEMFIDETSLKESYQGTDYLSQQKMYNYKVIFQKSIQDENYALRFSNVEEDK